MHSLKPDQGDPNWDEIIVELEAFFRSFIKGKPLFRRGKADIFLKGKSIRDYVYEAILQYLEDRDNYDPSKGPFIMYLKYYLLRNVINADLSSKENETTRDIYDRILQHDAEDDSMAYYDRLLPFTEALFDDEIDYGTIMAEIEVGVRKDKVCGEIFYGQSIGMKRRDIMEEFGLNAGEYVNGYKRLKTILSNISSLYDFEKPTP